MTESSKLISKKAGLPPGALVHIGERMMEKTKLTIVDYDISNFSLTICKTVEECSPFIKTETVSWINVDGLHDPEIISSIGTLFQLHPLLAEDVLNTGHRPKVEEFDNCLFLALKMIGIDKDGDSIVVEQISLILGKNWVISFQEQEGDIFDALRMRIRENKGSIRNKGADYLLYRLIDTVVDNYFSVSEHISEIIETLEEEVLHSTENKSLHKIQHVRNQLINFRKAVSPLREAVVSLEKDSSSLFEESTTQYLRDVYEHIIHINDSINSQHDMIANIMDLHLSGLSNKTNQVMKVLTIIATIFIPLTFIAGVYGMNFDNMPELHWRYGYYGVWGIMLLGLIIMLFYFKRKRWL